VRKVRYVPVTKRSLEAGPAAIVLQAVRLLDQAAMVALESGDTEKMLYISDKFIDLASKMEPAEEYVEEEEPVRHPIGFHNGE
jgi:hypothetical protein